jgi:hypothetical protein
MLLKEKFFIVSVIAAVVAGFLATHALRCLMQTFEGGCGFALASAVVAAVHCSAAFFCLWRS